jgi:hypothetical protein
VSESGLNPVAGGDVKTVLNDTIFDAKGDLPVGTGADTAAKLAVGTDGFALVADSSASSGLAYAQRGMNVPFANMTGTDAPAANTLVGAPDDIAGTQTWADLTGRVSVALVYNVNTAWSAGTKIRPQYSTDGGSTWAYLESSGTGLEVAGDATHSTPAGHTAYVTLVAAARTVVDLRMVAYSNGAGVTAGRLRQAMLVLK